MDGIYQVLKMKKEKKSKIVKQQYPSSSDSTFRRDMLITFLNIVVTKELKN